MERPGEEGEGSPPGLEAMWGMEATSGADCDCPGPPPEFLLPPPPRPSFLQSTDPTFCTEDTLPIETCDALPLIDASYRSNPSFQTSAVIVLCSVLLGLFVFIVVIVVWKHKRKVQNFLPCKTSPQNNCDGPTGPGVIYEDLHDVLPRTTPAHHHHHHHHHQYNHPAGGGRIAPTIEMIDVKNNIHYPSGYPISQHPPVFLCSSPGPDPYSSQDLYNPVYEELSDDSDLIVAATHSEDEFAEDELSLGGDLNDRRRLGDISHPHHSLRRFRRPHEPLPPIPNGNKRNRTLDRRRQEFHEGMLLDALLQLYPRVGGVEQQSTNSQGRRSAQQNQQTQLRQIPSINERIPPYETSVPVLGHLATFHRPKPCSQDSAFGSDSSYSNHTLRGSNRGGVRRDPRRLSQLSADLALT